MAARSAPDSIYTGSNFLPQVSLGCFLSIYDSGGTNYWIYKVTGATSGSTDQTVPVEWVGGVGAMVASGGTYKVVLTSGTKATTQRYGQWQEWTMPDDTTSYVTYDASFGWTYHTADRDFGATQPGTAMPADWNGITATVAGTITNFHFSGYSTDKTTGAIGLSFWKQGKSESGWITGASLVGGGSDTLVFDGPSEWHDLSVDITATNTVEVGDMFGCVLHRDASTAPLVIRGNFIFTVVG
jgi:hypothetical protein